jgi:peroxiredoxin Q/BCP
MILDVRRVLPALLLLFPALGAAAGAPLAPGSPAPPFALRGSDGETYTLARFVGKQAVVLAWFPKAFTPG